MKVYEYHHETGEFTGETFADVSPREPGVYHHPANTTIKPPPRTSKNQIAVWNGTKWNIIADHRGKEGWVNGEPIEIRDLGPLPDGWSDTLPEMTGTQKEMHELETRKNELDILLSQSMSDAVSHLEAVVGAILVSMEPSMLNRVERELSKLSTPSIKKDSEIELIRLYGEVDLHGNRAIKPQRQEWFEERAAIEEKIDTVQKAVISAAVNTRGI